MVAQNIMVDHANAMGGLEKLNNYNYDLWCTCMESYLQGQDLREIVDGIFKTTTLTPKLFRHYVSGASGMERPFSQ